MLVTNYKHAVVIGGSVAGLATAKVLAGFFKHVTVIERGSKPEDAMVRKQVPQGGHLHALLKKGELALEHLFPNIIPELEQKGAVRLNFTRDINWHHYNVWKARFHGVMTCLSVSRPCLEFTVRERVEKISNIRISYDSVVTNYQLNPENTQIIGVNVKDSKGEDTFLDTNLLVDASGANSQTPKWLEASGLQVPEEEHNDLPLAYTTRLYQMKDEVKDSTDKKRKAWLIYNDPPRTKCISGMFPIEDNKYVVTVAGYSDEKPGRDESDFHKSLDSFEQKDIVNQLKDAEPISEMRHYKLHKERRYHYQKLRNMPEGLLVMGDAFCRFDPIFGQGMSAATQAAVLLDECLKRTLVHNDNNGSINGLARLYHNKLSKLVDNPWLVTQIERFRYAETTGPKPLLLPILQWYVGHVFKLCESNENVYARFLDVMHLIKGPYSLLHPSVLFAVLKRQFTIKPVNRNNFASSTSSPVAEAVQE